MTPSRGPACPFGFRDKRRSAGVSPTPLAGQTPALRCLGQPLSLADVSKRYLLAVAGHNLGDVCSRATSCLSGWVSLPLSVIKACVRVPDAGAARDRLVLETGNRVGDV